MSNVVIRDTHTKHDAVMIPLRYDNNTPQNIIEYFLIENFHTQNDYAGANPFLIRSLHSQSLTHGLVVFHIENEDLTLPPNSHLDLETADGLFNWQVVEGENTPSDRTDDLIGYLFPSYYTGFDERDQIVITVSGINYTDYFALLPSSHPCLTGNPCPPPPPTT
ncbi:MAG: hypothetical protein GWN01_12600, partial [Nitrosopumilaceae archaeon]|nr:hypothetical protein [Nitrosopumilaceae archaeon]NIX62312.1 hypothetical protein [Nitrosopumilaceae archaeon]